MIDWKNVLPEDFYFEVDVDSIDTTATHHVFPVRVYYKNEKSDGEKFVFNHTVTIRSEFYDQLKNSSKWKEALGRILKSRVRDEILKRRQLQAVSIEEKVQLLDLN
jgi:hypothetical protein